jgi:hypothetical protein
MGLSHLEKVEEIQEIADEICTSWEIDFLESLREQLADGRKISERQEETLERIYKKAVDSPY